MGPFRAITVREHFVVEDVDAKIKDLLIEFRRPRFFAWPYLSRFMLPAVWIGIGWFASGWLTGNGPLPAARLVRVGGIAVVLAGRLWWTRKQGGLPPIIIAAQQITLPTTIFSRRVTTIPLEKFRSLAVVGWGWRTRLVIDAGWRPYRFPLSVFADADAPDRLRAALREVITARPGGARTWAAIAARERLAADIGRAWPFATLAVIVLVAAAFVAQRHALMASDAFGFIRIGAASPLLFAPDQWFRLVTANLLHLSVAHLVGNLAVLLWMGTLFERIAGWRNTLIVLLVTGILSQAASAGLGGALSHHIFSIGLSGAVYGLVATTVLTPQVDALGHGGGAIAGFVLGLALGLGCSDIETLRRPQPVRTLSAAALLAVWTGAVLMDMRHAGDTAASDADLATITAGMLTRVGDPPEVQNAYAWAVAVDPDATPEMLKQAAELADRAVAAQTRRDPKSFALADDTDTRAALSFRLGDVQQAAWQELHVVWQRQVFGAHLAQFLDQAWRKNGLWLVGEAGSAAPTITLAHGVIRFSETESSAKGARVYALLRRHDQVAGLLFFELPPRFSGTQLLPIPWSYGAPHTDAPPDVWTDADSEIRVAMFDRRGCACKDPRMTPIYIPLTPDLVVPAGPVSP